MARYDSMPASTPAHSVSVTPDPDESLIGYIFRLAARRHLSDARHLALECGFDRLTNRPELTWLDTLADLARVDYQQLEDVSFGPPDKLVGWFRDVEMPSNMFDRTLPAERRVCPECLAGKPLHRAVWDIKCIVPSEETDDRERCRSVRLPPRLRTPVVGSSTTVDRPLCGASGWKPVIAVGRTAPLGHEGR
ncbi:MAG: TniQ family protein [Janthinobacterium lividum]